jgi:hypothetical protein
MRDREHLDAMADRLIVARQAGRGLRHLATVAVELGEPVDSAGTSAIIAELRAAYLDVHEALAHGEPAEVVYLAARLDP